jgi:hypothetical protein
MTVLVCLSNRRSLYLPDALASARKHLSGWDSVIVVDDSGDPDWHHELTDREAVAVIPVADQPAGYTAAMRRTWTLGLGRIFLLEEDFVFVRDVNLSALHATLDGNPHLAQVALQRAPWYPIEYRAGVLRAQRQRVDRDRRLAGRLPTRWVRHPHYVEHDAGFTGNPCLISERAFEVEWPDVEWSETAAGDRMVEAGLSFAWYGREGEAAHVEHVGQQRAESSGGY